jgi:hypothetical protein
VGLERGPLNLVSTTEELLDRKPRIRPEGPVTLTLYPHTLAITSPTRGGRSVGIVRSRTQTQDFPGGPEKSLKFFNQLSLYLG